MRNLIFIIALLIVTTSCNGVIKKDLQLTGPTAEEAEQINKSTGIYVDGVYEASDIQTGLSYKQDYEPYKTYYLKYKPIIVVKNFKDLSADNDYSGRPVVTIALHDDVHESWFLATKRAFQNKEPLMIVLEGKVVSAPLIYEPISGGMLQISGNQSTEEIQKMIQGIKERHPEVKK